jgi:hypothetical protein
MDAINARGDVLNVMREDRLATIVFHERSNATIRHELHLMTLIQVCTPAPTLRILPPLEPSQDKQQSLIRVPTRTKELELMHHWCIKTCQSFTVRLANLFQGYVVQEAIKHEYLMESILALTSLHIASEMDDAISASSYVSAGLQYQNNAVHTFHTALQNITPSNCDAVFAASILTMACTIVSPVLSAGNNDRTKAPLESYLILFDFVKGISSITNTSRQWLETGPFGEIFWPDAKHVRDGQIIPSIMLLRNLNDTVNGNTNLDLHEVYQHSIGQLEKCVAIDKHTVIRWLGMVGKNFMNELRDKSPMALIIFMYWGVILDQLEELWWAKCLGKRLVEELSDSISGCGKEWDEAIRWATEQVGCNSPETDRSLGN